MHQKPQRFGLMGRKPQPGGRVGGDLQPHLAMILQMALAQVVNQQRQVQQMLLGKRAIDPAHGAAVRRKLRGKLHRPQAMLIDRVLVILVELQQPPGMLELGDESFEKAGTVHVAQQRRKPRGMGQQRKEMAARLGRRRLVGQLRGLVADRLPRRGGDRARRRDSPDRPAARWPSDFHCNVRRPRPVASRPAGPT